MKKRKQFLSFKTGMLDIQNISKSFFRYRALQDVSMSIPEGEIFGLLGPNGAGKTTLIRIINRIIEPDEGTVRWRGELLSQRHLQSIGYLPEERGLYRSMTVEDHALFLARLRGLSSKQAQEQLNKWLEKFNITDWKKKRIEELSKGMAQKVQFICTVLHDPSLLILDEPLSGFDPINVDLIMHELKEMRLSGKTIILSTHNMQSVEEICDRVALIHESKKILWGKVSELRNEMKKGEFAVRFRGNMIAFVNTLWTGFELVDKKELGNDRFEARLKMRGDNDFEGLLRTLMGQVSLEAAWEVLPSMQDVFMESVKPIPVEE
jgi:ABC-2 type transport system ATP-binding protein